MTPEREALDLYAALERDGFALSTSAGSLLVAPGSRLTAGQRAAVARLKPQLLALAEAVPAAGTQALLDAAPPPDFAGPVAVVSWSAETGAAVGSDAATLAAALPAWREHEAGVQARWQKNAAKAGDVTRPVRAAKAKRDATLFGEA